MTEFHKVTNEELPIIIQWLAPHLPESFTVYATALEIHNGRWYGHSFHTIGWPEIHGVLDINDEVPHPCPDIPSMVKLMSIFAPYSKDAESLFKEFCEWTKPFVLNAVNDSATSVLQRLAKEKKLEYCIKTHIEMMQANPGDIKARPIPDGFRLRKIDLESEAEHQYCARTWIFDAPMAPKYFKALISHFPNYCLTNGENEIVCFELGTEFGTIGMLNTKDEYRRKGLAKVLVSNLVQEYFKDDLPAVAWVEAGNAISLQLHLSLGFKHVSSLNNLMCAPAMSEENKDEYLYEFMNKRRNRTQ